MECRNALGPYSGKLLKALLGSSTIKSAPIRRDYVHAIGDVIRNAPYVRINL